MLEEYEINEDTQAILPIDSTKSVVYEQDAEYIVNQPSNKIINYNCNFYGSSYLGRCEGTKKLTGIKTKYPIIIEESRQIIFFPTSSTRNQQTQWISLNNIKSIEKKSDHSIIIFDNDKKINFDISYYSLNNQYIRANLLQSKLYERIIKKQSK
jgi:competence protein ComK